MSGCIGCSFQSSCEWNKNNLLENMFCNQTHPLKIVGYKNVTTVLMSSQGSFSEPIKHKKPLYK